MRQVAEQPADTAEGVGPAKVLRPANELAVLRQAGELVVLRPAEYRVLLPAGELIVVQPANELIVLRPAGGLMRHTCLLIYLSRELYTCLHDACPLVWTRVYTQDCTHVIAYVRGCGAG